MLKPSKVSIRGLRTFCAAAQQASFREAGDMLFITASAVSHQIKSLEEGLGGPVFVRAGRTITLTPLGQSLYNDIRPLIEQMDTVVSRHQHDASRTMLRVSVQPFFASELLVPRLREFSAMHPDIDLQIGTSDESSDKHPPEADLSIRLFESPPPSLACDRLFPLRLVPAGSPEFASQIKVKKGVIQTEFPIIVHETQADAWQNWSTASGIALPEGTRTIRLDSMIAVARAAEEGVGAALMPVPLGQRWFESGSLVRLFDQEWVAEVSYFLVWKIIHFVQVQKYQV